MPCAAGELYLVPASTPERPDGHECRGKCGGRLHGLCGEAEPNCDNPVPRVCHDGHATKRSSQGKAKAVKPQAGKRKASDTGGVDDTTRCPPGLRGAFVALRFSGESSGGVRLWRCLFLSAES